MRDKDLEICEDSHNRRENMEEPMEKCGEQCDYCKDKEKSLELKITSLEAQIDRDNKDHQYFLQRLRTALGSNFFTGSADEQVNIISSINELKKTLGPDVQAQRHNFEEQRSKVSKLESQIRSLEADKAHLLDSITVKDRAHSKELEEANERAAGAYEEVSDLENVLQECHMILDKYSIVEPYWDIETLPERITYMLKKLDPEYSEYLRLKEKFEDNKGE